MPATTPIGFRFDGRPFWPYLGGAEDGDEDPNDGDEDGDEDGGDGGVQRAIKAERARAKAARDAARPWRALAQELGVKNADEVRALLAKNKDTEKPDVDVDALVLKTRQEALSTAQRQIVGSTIEALAATGFADPEDAAKFLDLGDYEVDENGRVDRKVIRKDLEDLLARKPHLAKTSKRVDHEQGARGKAPASGVGMSDLIRRAAGRIQ